MTDTPAPARLVPIATRRLLGQAWPLLATAAVLVVAGILGTRGGMGVPTPWAEPSLLLLAASAFTCGVIALLRAPDVDGSDAVIGVAAAAAALLALGVPSTPALEMSFPAFLLTSPARYALTPIAVHLAFAIGWPHRHRYWFGVVVGWYMLHLAMWIAVVGGVAAGEEPLVHALDGTFRRLVLEPCGTAVALAAAGIASISPARRPSERHAAIWALAAIGLGMGPLLVVNWLGGIEQIALEGLRAIDLSLTAFPLLAVVGLLSLPFLDATLRDSRALALAQHVLEESGLQAALQAVAIGLREEFDAEGVSVRMADGLTHASVGRVRAVDVAASMTADAESSDDRRVLMAPIGRSSSPLGEVRLEARHAGAYGRREREWLVAFLVPVGTALRARRREHSWEERSRDVAHAVAQGAAELLAAARRLPAAPREDGMAVPPPVDAREVLGQLADGISRVARQGDGLEERSHAARDRVREASDQIAGALDALRGAATAMRRLAAHGEEINLSNQTVSGVAFRTNLLANNAALEATRAGSAGRTFGVLAEEIRRLADATASTSEAITDKTSALGRDVAEVARSIDAITGVLADAIRDAEAGEDAARQLGAAAAALESAARSLRPALEEANAVADRRSARDQHLTSTMEHLLDERTTMGRALTSHRETLDKLGASLERVAQRTANVRQVGTLGRRGS